MKKLILLLVLFAGIAESQVWYQTKVDTLKPYKNAAITFVPPLPYGLRTQTAATDSLWDAINALRARLDSLQAVVDSLGVRMDLLAAQMDALWARIEAIEARLALLELRVDDIAGSLDTLWVKHDSLKSYFNRTANTYNKSYFNSITTDSGYVNNLYIKYGNVFVSLSSYIDSVGGGGGGGLDSATVLALIGGQVGVRARYTDSTNTSSELNADGVLYANMGGTLDHSNPQGDGSIWVGYFDLFFELGGATGVKLGLTLPDPGYSVADVGVNYVITPGENDSAFASPFVYEQNYVAGTSTIETTGLELASAGTPVNHAVRVNFWVDNLNGETGYLKLRWAGKGGTATLLRGSNIVAYRLY
ncbi:MAG: hypothetical protein ABIH23_00520 [bacterium]